MSHGPHITDHVFTGSVVLVNKKNKNLPSPYPHTSNMHSSCQPLFFNKNTFQKGLLYALHMDMFTCIQQLRQCFDETKITNYTIRQQTKQVKLYTHS